MCPFRCGQHMPILRIRQRHRVFERFVTLDENVTNRRVHQLPRAIEFHRVKIRAIPLEVVENLVEYPLGSPSPD